MRVVRGVSQEDTKTRRLLRDLVTFASSCLPVILSVVAAGCGRDGTCLGGDDGACLPPSACTRLAFTCDDPRLELRRIVDVATDRPRGLDALAARGDVLLANSRVAVVLDDLDAPHYLAPTGGSIVDLAPRGDPSGDALNQILQIGGILPEDAAAYHTLELLDESPELVAVVARGVLEGRPGVTVVTRYEVRPCEPGVRIRTELFQGGRDPQTVFLADGYYWGDREVTPFVPLPGQGFTHPDLDLLEIERAFRPLPFMAAQSHEGGALPSSLATVPCDARILYGFQDPNVSAAGLAPAIVLPGDALAFERFVTVAPGAGLAGAVEHALEARHALFGERYVRVSGRAVTPDGAPVGGDERVASLLFVEPGAPSDRPWSEAVPAADGAFSVLLPVRRTMRAVPHVLGQPRGAPTPFETGDEDVTLGDVVVPASGRLGVTVTDDAGRGLLAEVVLTPADPARRPDVGGSVYGQFHEEKCAPYLGPPHGASPACNRALLEPDGTASFAVPAGAYLVYATHGPFWTLARAEVEVSVEETASVSLSLAPLPELLPEGVVSADLHVHAGASFDSSLPERDRARSFVATGVEVIAATDHDVVTSYDAALDELGLREQVVVLPGVETTGHILFLRPPGSEFPEVIGHYNFWPLAWDEALPKNGAPDDERLEPGALFDRMEPLFVGRGVRQLNHPFEETVFGRDQGYLTAIGWDPRDDVPLRPTDTPAGQLPRQPGGPGGAANIDHHVQEVLNGTSLRQLLWYRAAWFGLLRQGIVRGGTANSDSHSLATDVLGYPRNLVFGGHTVAAFDAERFDEDVRRGHLVGTNGPVVLATIDGADGEAHGPSVDPFRPAEGAELVLEVRAAPWIPVEEIRIVVDGEVARVIGDLASPADPFGTEGLVRWQGRVPLAELLGGLGADDDVFLVVEAGFPLWEAADLDDDGLVDTTDNDRDGDIDADDALPEEGDEGDFVGPARPEDPADPRFHLDVIAPGTWPSAFTNPFLLDRGEPGWREPRR